jgi:hypothetical protein
MSTSDGSSSDEFEKTLDITLQCQQMMGRVAHATNIFGMYYNDTYMNKSARREPEETGLDWVMRTLNNYKACYKMFRMTRPVFNCLHETLVDNYELKSTIGMSSIESLAMFSWTFGGPQSVSQVENRFWRSTETIVKKFNHMLDCLNRLGANNVKPKGPRFTIVHPRLQELHFFLIFMVSLGQ